jgi:hypothetical protein
VSGIYRIGGRRWKGGGHKKHRVFEYIIKEE